MITRINTVKYAVSTNDGLELFVYGDSSKSLRENLKAAGLENLNIRTAIASRDMNDDEVISNVEAIAVAQVSNLLKEICAKKGVATYAVPDMTIKELPTNITFLGSYRATDKRVFLNVARINKYIEENGVSELQATVLVLAHELTHYVQDMMGCTFDHTENYENRWQEIEARTISEEIAARF